MMKEVASVLEDDDIKLDIEYWGTRGKKILNKIPSVGHLRYECFKQNIKNTNFIDQILEALSEYWRNLIFKFNKLLLSYYWKIWRRNYIILWLRNDKMSFCYHSNY